MGYKGRFLAIGIVLLFNILRYFYYHQYFQLPFEASFFILTSVFLIVAWAAGKQYDLAKYYAEKDPLTDTYNRRTINKVFHEKVLFFRNKNKKFAVVVIDLDNFKDINDSFGHQKGDELLKYVASVIKRNGKKNDFVIRWGGDEFLHFVSDIVDGFQKDYKQKLKKELAHSEIPLIPSIGVSIGVAIYPNHGESIEKLLQEADVEMYRMKEYEDIAN